MTSHKKYWQSKHQKSDHLATGGATDFARVVNDVIEANSKILELGCGHGHDACYFAEQGHGILATDFSEKVIASNSQRHPYKNLSFEVLDISNPMPFASQSFDVIYASFSLHYFTDAITKQIMQELRRILKPDGYLCFICKSTNDSYYGQGEAMEKDMYAFNGGIKHFFSEAYVRECLGDMFQIQDLENGEKTFFSYLAGYVQVIARPVNV
jgi:ubiquinone/menaquinone biosynthesis C-methylase UbiE